jgi:hypothetical protein
MIMISYAVSGLPETGDMLFRLSPAISETRGQSLHPIESMARSRQPALVSSLLKDSINYSG